MKTKITVKKIIALIIILGLAAYSLSVKKTVQAQNVLPLMVSPARNEIEVSPGEKTAVTINFYDQSDDPVSGFFKTADFIVDNNQGNPRLIENPDEAPAKYAASNWFTLLYDRATLPAHDKVSLQATINVPKDAHPGGRYVAVYFEQGAVVPQKTGVNEEAGSGTTSRIASLVYIKVKGPITEKAIVSDFFAPIFFEYGPIKVTTGILNRGDYHISPKGIISLSNMFGGLVDQSRLKDQNVFPDVSRTYENELGTKWMMGRYKLNLAASYGDQGQALTSSIYVWVFPWRVATAIILTLIVIILIISRLYRNFYRKEAGLEEELAKEKAEIEKLKESLRKKGV